MAEDFKDLIRMQDEELAELRTRAAELAGRGAEAIVGLLGAASGQPRLEKFTKQDGGRVSPKDLVQETIEKAEDSLKSEDEDENEDGDESEDEDEA